MITKSAYLKGRQCLKRFWLLSNGHDEPEIDPEEVWEERVREGVQVEGYAEQLFPGGVRISSPSDTEDGDGPEWKGHREATREALRGTAPIFQARLEHEDLLAIADILEPSRGGWYLWEVKASTYKPGEWTVLFDWDLAFQVHLARRSGLAVVGCGVILLSRDFVRDSKEVNPRALLVRVDRSSNVELLLPHVDSELTAMRATLALETAPVELPGARCKGSRENQAGNRVSTCGHLASAGQCGRRLPPNWAGRLPDLRGVKEQGISSVPNVAIEDLDIDDPVLDWTQRQRWAIQAVQSGEPFVDAGALRRELDRIKWPVAYVDFEFDPGVAVPKFEGCRPYDRIPFQWALVIQDAAGAALGPQQDFLHLDETDPSRPFAEALLAAVPQSGSLVAHHASAEITVLRRLAERLGGDLGDALTALTSRFVDSEAIARAGYYHPAQQGSWSIKKLAPALLGRGYDDLEIRNGMAAVMAWRKAIRARGAEREMLGRELRAYCGRDAILMHGILEGLKAVAGDA